MAGAVEMGSAAGKHNSVFGGNLKHGGTFGIFGLKSTQGPVYSPKYNKFKTY